MSNITERLDSILDLLRSKLSQSGGTDSRVYIFLLDKLEYFCEGVQLLLYNLLDACSSGQVWIKKNHFVKQCIYVCICVVVCSSETRRK